MYVILGFTRGTKPIECVNMCVCIYIYGERESAHARKRACTHTCTGWEEERERDFKELAHMVVETWRV